MTKPVLWIDVETYSEADIKRVGAWRYANDPSTQIICVAWAFDDEAPRCEQWEFVDFLSVGNPLIALIRDGYEYRAHNAGFEKAILDRLFDSPFEDWTDVAAHAAANGLPRKLETLCTVLRIPRDLAKDKRGARLINLLSKPQKDGTRLRDAALEQEMREYCAADVVAMRECWKRLPDTTLTPMEKRVMVVDMKINDRGVAVDVDLAYAAGDLYAKLVADADVELGVATQGRVTSTSQVAELTKELAVVGCSVTDLRAATVTEWLANPAITYKAKRLLQLRQIGAKTAGSKFERFTELADIDGRAHSLHMYYGAHTGRWAGRLLQPQNFPRPTIKDTDTAADCVKAGVLDVFYDNQMSALNSVVRSCIVAPKGKVLLVGDFASIEARVIAWLAGQQDVLEVFRTHGLIYEATAARVFNCAIDKVTKEQRQVGKVAVLALGFGGGAAAFEKMAAAYNVALPAFVTGIVHTWRKANAKIVQFWYDLENAVKALLAEAHNGDVITVGKVVLGLRGKTLLIKLPSGHKLRYHQCSIGEDDGIQYYGVDPKTFNWAKQTTWGGSLAENVTQAVARDLLAEALVRLDEQQFPVVLHVHDEVLGEVNDYGTGRFTKMVFQTCLETLPDWATGLPVAADCHTMTRYRKT